VPYEIYLNNLKEENNNKCSWKCISEWK